MNAVQRDEEEVATFDLTQFDSPSTAVVTAVAEASDADPIALESLYDVVDPDALDSVVATGSSRGAPDASVGFSYGEYWVVVKGNGRGYLYDPSDRPASA